VSSRALVSRLARGAAFGRLVAVLERLDGRSDRAVPVLTYHRIDREEHTPGLDPRLISATPEEFERQMAYVAAYRQALTLDELLAVRRGERPLPPRPVVVTFDDAYRDFAEHAWPVLRRHGVPATLFVPTSYPGEPARAFWWDRVHAALTLTSRRSPVDTPAGRLPLATPEERASGLRALHEWIEAAPHAHALAAVDRLADDLDVPPPHGTVLGWRELKTLADEGLALAPHTRTHPLLHRIPLEEAKAEVTGSRDDLRRELGAAHPAFAFPGGGRTPELVAWLPQAGFELAFTTARGGNRLAGADWLSLRRINVGRRSSVPVIRAQLLSWAARRRAGPAAVRA
jgi:peptidoglycan/xylan/chitin deacetylase (PgdA/CDA1 family)